MTILIQRLNLSDRRRVYVVGDIHGCFDLLNMKLNVLGFDETRDALLSVGDLVDRGPNNERVEDFLDKGWFYPVRGNHELMTDKRFAGSDWHVANGGRWYREYANQHSEEAAEALGERLNSLPYAIEANLGDKTVGVIHASTDDVDDWNDLEQRLKESEPLMENPFVWDRLHIGKAKRCVMFDPAMNDEDSKVFNIKNIDHVFMGHTPLKEPLTYGNCSWIDTGAFATDNLTVLRIK